MKTILKWTDKRFQEENWQSYGFHYKENNKNTCLTWTWQGEDLYLGQQSMWHDMAIYLKQRFNNYSPFVAFNQTCVSENGVVCGEPKQRISTRTLISS